MANWVLIPCLKQLFAEFDRIAPGRDKATDGSIGDSSHQSSVSDHNADETGNVPIHDADRANEVHAIDVDADLRVVGLSMEMVVQFLLARCRSGAETRLRYIIFNRRIWEASNDWRQREYTGPSPHTEHGHFSASYDTNREASTASWHLEDLVPMTPADARLVASTLLNTEVDFPYDAKNPKRRVRDLISSIASLSLVDAKLAPRFTALAAAVAGVDEAVLAGLADAGRSDEDLAAGLRAALGDRATAVGRLLAGA